MSDSIFNVPHAIDPVTQRIGIVRLSESQIRATAFLDGRDASWPPSSCWISIDELPTAMSTPPPMIAHVAFCGSTQLSRLLDVPGRTLMLREPNVQIALSDWQASGAPAGVFERARVGCHTVLSTLDPALVTVLKPTSWANPLLLTFADDPDWRVLLLTLPNRDFLRAVFRGGRDRIAYAMRSAQHFVAASQNAVGARLLQTAAEPTADPLERAARLVLVMLRLQEDIFASVARVAGDRALKMQVLNSPNSFPELAHAAALHLRLPILEADIQLADNRASGRHSKGAGQLFDARHEQQANDEVERHHGQIFDCALAWLEEQPRSF